MIGQEGCVLMYIEPELMGRLEAGLWIIACDNGSTHGERAMSGTEWRRRLGEDGVPRWWMMESWVSEFVPFIGSCSLGARS